MVGNAKIGKVSEVFFSFLLPLQLLAVVVSMPNVTCDVLLDIHPPANPRRANHISTRLITNHQPEISSCIPSCMVNTLPRYLKRLVIPV